jgi:hypothetical protein
LLKEAAMTDTSPQIEQLAREKRKARTGEERFLMGADEGIEARAVRAYLRAHLARAFLEQPPLNEFCRALFNLNEFVYAK